MNGRFKLVVVNLRVGQNVVPLFVIPGSSQPSSAERPVRIFLRADAARAEIERRIAVGTPPVEVLMLSFEVSVQQPQRNHAFNRTAVPAFPVRVAIVIEYICYHGPTGKIAFIQQSIQ